MANILNLFKFIESKRKQYHVPLRYKLINNLPVTKDELNVRGSLNLNNTPIQSLPNNLKVNRSLNLSRTQITSLPDDLKVGWSLLLSHTLIQSLPDNLKVGGLDLSHTPIQSLPDNLTVRNGLNLSNTPISKKYTKEQIIKMIEEKGGSVKGIYIF